MPTRLEVRVQGATVHPSDPAEPISMDIKGADQVGMQYTVGVEKLRQGSAKAEGEAAVKLIAESEAPPVGVNGEGSHVNTYA